MAKKPGGLGRQYYEIFDDNAFTSSQNNVAQSLRISDIEPRKDQPRKDFNREALESLADSISTMGVLQPIVVRENLQYPGTYEIIAGERRWRAAKMAGLSEIPAVVLDSDELKTAQVALIENLQRENLNAIEEAMAYEALIEKFSLTQDQIAKQVGKSRSAVANTLRLLDLPEAISEMVKEGKLSAGHARTLLPLEDPEEMETAANRIIARSLSVRDAEALVKRILAQGSIADQVDLNSEKGLEKLTRIHMKELEDRARATIGRRIRITNTGKKKTLELAFENNEDLEALLKILCGQDFFKNEQF